MTPSSAPHAFCFGKLPVAGDFVRGDAGAPELGQLDAWVHDGMHRSQQLLGADWQARFDAVPPMQFLWWNDASGAALAGWWLASRDAAGRRYPFLLAARMVHVDADNHARLVAGLEEFFAGGSKLVSEGWDGLDAAGCAARVRDLPVAYDDSIAQRRCAELLDDGETGALGTAEGPALVLKDLADLGGSRPRYCLRWPLRDATRDPSFWLAAMRRVGAEPPRLMLWDSGPNARLRVAWGDLDARLFAGMVFSELDDDGAYDAGRAFGDAARETDAQSRFGAAVEQGNLSSTLAALGGER